MRRSVIEVKFFVYEDEIITEEVRHALNGAISKHRNFIESNYEKISKFVGYKPDYRDVLGSFSVMFEEELISCVVKDVLKKEVSFQEEVIKYIDVLIEVLSQDEKFVAKAMCMAIENQPRKSTWDNIELNRAIKTIKFTYIDNKDWN